MEIENPQCEITPELHICKGRMPALSAYNVGVELITTSMSVDQSTYSISSFAKKK